MRKKVPIDGLVDVSDPLCMCVTMQKNLVFVFFFEKVEMLFLKDFSECKVDIKRMNFI